MSAETYEEFLSLVPRLHLHKADNLRCSQREMENGGRLGEDEEQTQTSKNDGTAAVHDEAITKELSHVEAIQKAKEFISQLLSDPFLQDLPPDISLDEVKSKLALEQGRAITLNLRRYDDQVIRKNKYYNCMCPHAWLPWIHKNK